MKKEKKLYEELLKAYKKATLITYGSPDQYQYRQNQLCKKIAEFILLPYLKELDEIKDIASK